MPDAARDQIAEHRAVTEAIDALLPALAHVTERLCDAFEAGGRLYTFGNGGSAADAQHLAAELIGRYKRERRPLPAVALSVAASSIAARRDKASGVLRSSDRASTTPESTGPGAVSPATRYKRSRVALLWARSWSDHSSG